MSEHEARTLVSQLTYSEKLLLKEMLLSLKAERDSKANEKDS